MTGGGASSDRLTGESRGSRPGSSTASSRSEAAEGSGEAALLPGVEMAEASEAGRPRASTAPAPVLPAVARAATTPALLSSKSAEAEDVESRGSSLAGIRSKTTRRLKVDGMRRKSLFNTQTLAFSVAVPDSEILSFAELEECLEHLHSFADVHAAAKPRALILEGMFQTRMGNVRPRPSAARAHVHAHVHARAVARAVAHAATSTPSPSPRPCRRALPRALPHPPSPRPSRRLSTAPSTCRRR